MIELTEVMPEQKELLWNIHQKYLYEMTIYYDDEMDESGNYHYGYFELYFSEPERKVLFIRDEESIVGFAMINPYSYIGEKPDYVLAEFTVFPMYRKKHIAIHAVKLIFEQYKGNWEIKYNEKNTAAKNLWTKVTEVYSPRSIKLNDEETVLSFCNERMIC